MLLPTPDITGASLVAQTPASVGALGLIPGLVRSTREGNGNPLQYSCLENSMDRGAWQATAWSQTESDMTEQLTLYLCF